LFYAVNPLQIAEDVPAAETGSAMSFYQLNRTVAYSGASALSATLLVLSVPHGHGYGHGLPTDGGYSAAALTSTCVLAAALAASVVFAIPARTGRIDS
jgi:hypothetical protein